MSIAFAFLTAAGVFLTVMSLFAAPRPLAATNLGSRLGALTPSLFDQDQIQRARPLVDRLVQLLFASPGARLGASLDRQHADERRLKLAGWPKPYSSVEAFYAYKIAIPLWMALVGLAIGAVLSLALPGTAPASLPLALALEQGGSVAPALHAMAQDAREKLNLILEERAGRNTLLMIAPLGMVITTALAILIAPGASAALEMFGGAGIF
jgi:hypothetical protein